MVNNMEESKEILKEAEAGKDSRNVSEHERATELMNSQKT